MIPRKLLRGDKFTALYDLWNQLVDHLHEIRPVAGAGIRIQRLPAGTQFSARSSGGGGGGGGAAEGDLGPFAVTLELNPESQKVMVKMFNSAAPESELAGIVTVGSTRFEAKKQEWEPKKGQLFCDVTCNAESEEYKVTFALEEKLPETKDEKRFILRLAEITQNQDNQVYTVAQVRKVGDIEVTGRWVK